MKSHSVNVVPNQSVITENANISSRRGRLLLCFVVFLRESSKYKHFFHVELFWRKVGIYFNFKSFLNIHEVQVV